VMVVALAANGVAASRLVASNAARRRMFKSLKSIVAGRALFLWSGQWFCPDTGQPEITRKL
ncbi:hypothetical protein, partial [Komagataeibacter saccharivorans]|uniref:hypothetical protein n=1 Tax=Komagataeibacter saccharivorans TaxID=265959 RepID=UPI00222F6A69